MTEAQAKKAKLLKSLHHNGKLLILPNVWDVTGAALLEKIGYSAIATASGATAFSHGFKDGENLPFGELMLFLNRITKNVSIPVTADVEHCYAANKSQLAENVKKLIETGIVGINYEDGIKGGNDLIPIDEQCENISIIKKAANEMGVSLFINARTDAYIKSGFSDDERLDETIKRGKAYKAAGADCLYPIILKAETALREIAKEVALPINIMLLPEAPNLNVLKEIGVHRLSLGAGFMKIALNAMKNTAEKLLHQENMGDIVNNPITSDYLNNLITTFQHSIFTK